MEQQGQAISGMSKQRCMPRGVAYCRLPGLELPRPFRSFLASRGGKGRLRGRQGAPPHLPTRCTLLLPPCCYLKLAAQCCSLHAATDEPSRNATPDLHTLMCAKVLARLGAVLHASAERVRWTSMYDLWLNLYSYATILSPSLLTAPKWVSGGAG